MRDQNSAEWKASMQDEMDSFDKNQVFELVDPPANRKILGNRWVYKTKYDASGNIRKRRARLVIQGFEQKEGIDYQETFSPVVRFDTIRTLISIAASESLEIKQFDVKTAFLHAKVDEEIYMRQPKGFEDGSNKVCKLQKSIYGLKQASRCWNQRLTSFLKKFHLKPSDADPCLFYSANEERLIVAVYIDDGIVVGKNQKLIDFLLKSLKKEFEITFSDPETFIGLQIEKNQDGSIFVHQSVYAQKVLERFNMQDTNSVTIPADVSLEKNAYLKRNEEHYTRAPYREAIGSLMYLAIGTRPDISLAVNKAARFMEKPTKHNWQEVKRILKYIKGTSDYGLFFKKNNTQVQLNVYSDSDCAADISTRISTTGYVVMLGTSVISWSSQKQSSVAQSTTDAEYFAANQASREIVWIKKLLSPLYNCQVPTTLFVDNQSALKMIKNPEFHKRTKHIDIKFHYIREKFNEGVFKLEYINTRNQVADILTKPLPRPAFEFHQRVLGYKKETIGY